MYTDKEIILYFSRGTSNKKNGRTFKDNLDDTIAKPLNKSKINQIIDSDVLDPEKEEATIDYIKNNMENIFVWGTSNWNVSTFDESFQDFIKDVDDDSKKVFMIFILDFNIKFIGEIKHVNPIVNGKIGEELWYDNRYGHIWFLKEIKKINNEDDVDKLIKTANKNLGLDLSYLGEKKERPIFYTQNVNMSKIDENYKNIGKEKLKKLLDIIKGEDIETIKGLKNKEINHISIGIWKLLLDKKQVILYGPPGTGKTYKTKKISVDLLNK